MKSTHPDAFDYDAIPVGYYDEVFCLGKGIQSKWHHLKFKRVRREFPPRGDHLDVACGPGTFIGTLPTSINSIGVDISGPQINYATQKYGTSYHSFKTMVPGRLDFPDSIVDIVTSIELIEHIELQESVQLLRECNRVLRPGGKMVVTTPNYAFLWPVIEWFVNRFGKVSYKDQHITKFNPQRLGELLVASGFSRVKVETCLWTAPFTAAMGWEFADTIDRLEAAPIGRRIGHLLIGVGYKQ